MLKSASQYGSTQCIFFLSAMHLQDIDCINVIPRCVLDLLTTRRDLLMAFPCFWVTELSPNYYIEQLPYILPIAMVFFLLKYECTVLEVNPNTDGLGTELVFIGQTVLLPTSLSKPSLWMVTHSSDIYIPDQDIEKSVSSNKKCQHD